MILILAIRIPSNVQKLSAYVKNEYNNPVKEIIYYFFELSFNKSKSIPHCCCSRVSCGPDVVANVLGQENINMSLVKVVDIIH